MQIWKDIPGYNGMYQASTLGLIRTKYQTEHYSDWKIMKPQMDKDCYLTVNLTFEGKQYKEKINRLVLKTFVPIDNEDKMTSSHINEIRWDNRLENLTWLSLQDNINYGGRNAQIGKPVYCLNTNNWYPSATEAGRQTGINNGSIGQACKGKIKTAGGMTWQFLSYEEAVKIKANICK